MKTSSFAIIQIALFLAHYTSSQETRTYTCNRGDSTEEDECYFAVFETSECAAYHGTLSGCSILGINCTQCTITSGSDSKFATATNVLLEWCSDNENGNLMTYDAANQIHFSVCP